MTVSHGKPYAGNLHVRFDEGADVPDEGRADALKNEAPPLPESSLIFRCAIRFVRPGLLRRGPSSSCRPRL